MPSTDKPILIFVPGLGANERVYDLFLKPLRQTYEVVSADLPVNLPPELTWEFFLSVVDQAVAGREVYMIGHSLGGAIALKYAATYPDRVRRLVVVAPLIFPLRKHREYVGLSRFMWYRRLRSGLMAVASGHLHHLREVMRIRQATLGEGKRERLYEWINRVDLAPDLPNLRHATVFWPRHEELIDPQTYQRLQDYTNIKTMKVPGSHNNLALAPRKLVPIVKGALRDQT